MGIQLVKKLVERETGRLVLQRLLDPDPNRLFPSWHPMAGQYGAPGIYFGTSCKNLWRELNAIQYIDGPSGDTVKEDDHGFDSLWHVLPVFERELVKPHGRQVTQVVARSVPHQTPTGLPTEGRTRRGRQVVAGRR